MKHKEKSLARNAILSSIRTLSAIIFPFVTYPYITRVLSVENIGRINFGNSIVSYFSLIGAMGISSFAIRTGSGLRNDIKKLNKFSNQIFTINLITAFIAYLLLIITLFLPTKISSYKDIIMLQGLTIVMAPLSVEWLYSIEEDFAYITIRSVLIQLCSLFFMFLFVKTKSDTYKYIILCVIASSMGNIFNFIYSKKYIKLKLTRNTKWNSYKYSILTFFVNSITTVIYLNSDITLLGMWCNDYIVGLYSVATKVYSIVKQIFNAVIGAAIPRLAHLAIEQYEDFIELVKKIISIACIFTIPAAAGIIVLQKEIVFFISGNAYIKAATSLAILSIAILFAVLSNVIANGVLICLRKEKYVLRATMLSASINIGLNFIFIPIWGERGAALTTVIAEIVMFCCSIYFARKVVGQLFQWRTILTALISSGIMVWIAKIINLQMSDMESILKIIVIIPICIIVYFTLLFLFKEPIFSNKARLVINKYLMRKSK